MTPGEIIGSLREEVFCIVKGTHLEGQGWDIKVQSNV